MTWHASCGQGSRELQGRGRVRAATGNRCSCCALALRLCLLAVSQLMAAGKTGCRALSVVFASVGSGRLGSVGKGTVPDGMQYSRAPASHAAVKRVML